MKRCFHCMGEYEEELQCCPVCEFTGEQEKGTWLEPGSILQGRYIVGTCRYQKEFDILYIGWDALFSRRILIQEFVPRSWGVRTEEGNLSIPDSKMELFEEAKNVFMSTGLKLISLDDTPGLLNVFSVFEDNNTAYITMEYPGEKTLLTILNTCGCFQENDMLYHVKELAIPLKRAHKNQHYHGQL